MELPPAGRVVKGALYLYYSILDDRSYQKFLVEGGFVMEFEIATGFVEFDWILQPRLLF